MSNIHFPDSSTKFQPVTIRCNDTQLKTRALIDSGADANLIDPTLVHQLNIPVTSVEKPRQASALDGRPVGRVTQCTVPIKLCIYGNHCEDVSLHLIT